MAEESVCVSAWMSHTAVLCQNTQAKKYSVLLPQKTTFGR